MSHIMTRSKSRAEKTVLSVPDTIPNPIQDIIARIESGFDKIQIQISKMEDGFDRIQLQMYAVEGRLYRHIERTKYNL